MDENRINQIDEEILGYIEADIMGTKKEEVGMLDNPRYPDFVLEYVFNNYEKTISDIDVEFLENYIKNRIKEVKAGLKGKNSSLKKLKEYRNKSLQNTRGTVHLDKHEVER